MQIIINLGLLEFFFSSTGRQHLVVLKDVNLQLALRLPKHEERIEKVQKFITTLKIKQEKQKEILERKRQLLKKDIRTATRQLIQYIFPLGLVDSSAERYTFMLLKIIYFNSRITILFFLTLNNNSTPIFNLN